MKIIKGGICAPKGFFASATEANIKYKNRTDMAMIFSKVPAISAGTYTTNLVKAAPVLWDRKITDSETYVNAIVINSGIANACTKDEGMEYCKQSAKKVASELGVEENSILLASTGVIGMQLPIEKICAGIESLSNSLEQSEKAANEAAKAIMTTDTVSKEIAIEFEISGKTVKMGAMCKGSGMIHPNMATMLSYVVTDAAVSKEILTDIQKKITDTTFNMVTVDGDTSTNDTATIIANGAAGNDIIDKATGSEYSDFYDAVYFVTETLAKAIAADGEGATRMMEIDLKGAEDQEQARVIARSVASSNLVKSAIHGADANWGRVLAAMGYSGKNFDQTKVDVAFSSSNGSIDVFKQGIPLNFDEGKALEILKADEVTINIDMNAGESAIKAWGCDLSEQYVVINGSYRS